MREAIQINGLTRDYGGGKGIFELTFCVNAGEVFGFLGPNGAGKTTTIRHLMGYLRPHRGSCRIQDADCWKEATQVQANLGYIPGEMAFPEGMTGETFLDFYARYRGMKTTGRLKELADRFELDTTGNLKKMSKGMKQKVGIVAAFMHDPTVLILDEPTSGLDPLMQNRFIELILEERRRGKTILMSSHMFEEVERTCERVGIVRQGKMVDIDTVDALKAQQRRQYIVSFESEQAAKAFAALGFEVELNGARATVTVKDDLQKLFEALSAYPVSDLSSPNQSLEEIFLAYYGGDET